MTKHWTVLVTASLPALLALFAPAPVARADIFQWQYINPANPSQGKQPGTQLCLGGAGAYAGPGANLANRNLTRAYLIGADLSAYSYIIYDEDGNPNYCSISTDLTGTNLSQADLTNANLYGAVLTGANLSQTNLTNAGFVYATLTGANLAGAEVRGANFFQNPYSGTGITTAQLYSTASYQAHDLTGVGLDGINLTGGNLASQNLTNAYFYGATLTGANLNHANLTNTGLNYATLTGANLRQANLTNAKFDGANLTNADLSQANLTNANFGFFSPSYPSANLTGANLSQANLTNASLLEATLTGANLTGAEVRGANLRNTGITAAQLYSTASYQAHDLTGIGLGGNNLTGANLVGQNLTDANLYGAVLTGANFTGAEVRGATFSDLTTAQLYSTASYQAHNLTGIGLSGNFAGINLAAQNLTNAGFGSDTLTSANFSRANLTNANFYYATLTGANFTNAEVRGANFVPFDSANGITLSQLYSTASYQAHDLTGIGLVGNNLTGANLAGQNLTNANFGNDYGPTDLTGANLSQANLTNANFLNSTLTGASFSQAKLTNANFLNATLTGASFRQANLTNAVFHGAKLANANLSQANLTNVVFTSYYYDGADLTGANLSQANLTNANFSTYVDYVYVANLTGANLSQANLTNANFSGLVGSDEYGEYIAPGANLTNANLSGADARGANFQYATLSGAITSNMIQSDGHIAGLDLTAGASLVVRDYAGDPSRGLGPIPVIVQDHVTLGNGSALAVNGGTLRFTLTSGSPTIGTGVQATVNGSATLELAGSVSALSSASNRVNIVNNSSAAAGLLVSGTHQKVGNIDGSGNTQVNAGSDLTANHIIQSALIIGGTLGSPGLVTIDASDASGNPLIQTSEFALAGSLTPNSAVGAGDTSFANLGRLAAGDTDLLSLVAGNSAVSGNSFSIPEPSTLALVLLAVLGVVSTRFARHHFRCKTNRSA